MYERILIDIDNTITSLLPTMVEMARYFHRPVPKIEEITDYNLSSVFGIPETEAMTFWQTMEYRLCEHSIVAFERFSNILEQFVGDGTRIYIITNRNEKFREVTEKWLELNNIKYDELHFTSGKSKTELIQELEIDAVVDDKPALFSEVMNIKMGRAEDGLSIYDCDMICVDYPYNRYSPCDIRISSKTGLPILGNESYEY